MKSLFPILFVLLPAIAHAQNNKSWLSLIFKNADSVLLVSHDHTQGIVIVDSAGNKIPLPKLIVNGKPNYKIIRERQTVEGKQLDSLIKILKRPKIAGELKQVTAICHITPFLFSGMGSYPILIYVLGAEDLKHLQTWIKSKDLIVLNGKCSIIFSHHLDLNINSDHLITD